MPLGLNFPSDAYAVIDPAERWYPGSEELQLAEASKLIPPLVAEIRLKVHEWRLAGYPDVTETSRALLAHWFKTDHLLPQADGTMSEFRYYFAQREAVEGG